MTTARELLKKLEALPEDQKDMDILSADNDFMFYELDGVLRLGNILNGCELTEHDEEFDKSFRVLLLS